MFLACDDVLPVGRTEPGSWIELCERELVGQLDFLKRAVAEELVIADPAAVHIQSNPETGEDCKCPSGSANFASRFQTEAIKGPFACPEQFPHCQGEEGGDGGPT